MPHKFKPKSLPIMVKEPPVSAAEMTLRDWFAACAMEGGISEFYRAGDTWSDWDDFAASCYNVADAMLRERKKDA